MLPTRNAALNSVPAQAGAQPVKEFEIPMALTRLAEAIGEQEVLLNKLSNRLQPAIRPVPTSPETKDKASAPSLCGIAETLMVQYDKISTNTNTITYLLDNLEF